MLQSLLVRPLGRLTLSSNITRGVVGISRLPLSVYTTRSFLTSSPVLEEKKAQTSKAKKVKKAIKPKEPKLNKKDIVAPFKRPGYGFAAYIQQYRAETGSSSLKEIMKEASVKWNAFSEEEKKKYALPEGVLSAYYADLKKWRDGLSNAERKVLGLKRFVAPRPATAYQMVLKEDFKENPGKTFEEVIRLASARYKTLSDEQRKELSRQALAEFNASKA